METFNLILVIAIFIAYVYTLISYRKLIKEFNELTEQKDICEMILIKTAKGEGKLIMKKGQIDYVDMKGRDSLIQSVDKFLHKASLKEMKQIARIFGFSLKGKRTKNAISQILRKEFIKLFDDFEKATQEDRKKLIDKLEKAWKELDVS